MPNLQTNCCLKQDFRKEDQLQNLELHVHYSGEYKIDIKKSNGNKPNSIL